MAGDIEEPCSVCLETFKRAEPNIAEREGPAKAGRGFPPGMWINVCEGHDDYAMKVETSSVKRTKRGTR